MTGNQKIPAQVNVKIELWKLKFMCWGDQGGFKIIFKNFKKIWINLQKFYQKINFYINNFKSSFGVLKISLKKINFIYSKFNKKKF